MLVAGVLVAEPRHVGCEPLPDEQAGVVGMGMIGVPEAERREHRRRRERGERRLEHLDDVVAAGPRGSLEVRVLHEIEPARRGPEQRQRGGVFGAARDMDLVAGHEPAQRVPSFHRGRIGLGPSSEHRHDRGAGMRIEEMRAPEHRIVQMRRDDDHTLELGGRDESPRAHFRDERLAHSEKYCVWQADAPSHNI